MPAAAPAGRPVATPQMGHGNGETPVPSPEKKKLRIDEDKSSNAAVPMVVKMEPSPTLPDPPTEVESQPQPEDNVMASPTAPTIAGDVGNGGGTAALAEPSDGPKQVGNANHENLEGQPMSIEPQNLEGQFAKAVDVTGNQTPPTSPGAMAALMVLWLLVDWGYKLC